MKNKIFILIAALCAALPMMGQTDVTSKYLKNADFSAGWSSSDVGNNTIATVGAWQGTSSGTDWFYGGAIGYASGKNVNAANPGKNPDGSTEGGALGLSIGWGCTIQYTQEVTLPAGVYTLEYTYYNTNDATQATNLMGYIDAQGVGHYGSTNNFVSGQWTTERVNFTVSAISTGKISLGIGAISGGSGANAKVFVDHVRLLKSDDATTAVNTGGWGGSGNYSKDGVTGSEVFQWAASLPLGVRMSQNVNLPDGKYRVEMYAMASSTSGRDNTSNVITNGSTEYVSLHVGDQSIGIPAYNREAFDAFDSYVFDCVDVENGVLTISLNEDKEGPNWLVMQIKSLTYLGRPKLGDVNMSGVADIADVTELVNIILGKSTDKYNTGNINQTGDIDVADVTELVNIILGKTVIPQNVLVNGTLHAKQDGNNALTCNNVLDEETAEPITDYDMQGQLTRVAINVAMSNVADVSIYSKDHCTIAGEFSYLSRRNKCNASGNGITYASSSASDVVCVSKGNNGVYTAQLLPCELANGIIVTVRTTDGKFYSQDFSGIQSGKENTLNFTQTAAENLWMTTIPGTTYFSMISTPGAHDACTSSVTSYTNIAKCQDTDLAGLLARGVRAFDIRPRYTSNTQSDIELANLEVYHGYVATGVKFKDAIDILINFVKEHPSEAISVIMNKESTKLVTEPKDQSETWRASLRECFNDASRSPYLMGGVRAYHTLNDVRGKVSIVCRNPYGNASNNYRDVVYGAIIENWPDDASKTDYSCQMTQSWNWYECSASVEDEYNKNGTNKVNAAKALLEIASANTDRARYHYTYTSSANSPQSYAKSQNPQVAEYIVGTLTGPTGYVYGDYMGSSSVTGEDLLKAVINQNYKYVFQGR